MKQKNGSHIHENSNLEYIIASANLPVKVDVPSLLVTPMVTSYDPFQWLLEHLQLPSGQSGWEMFSVPFPPHPVE